MCVCVLNVITHVKWCRRIHCFCNSSGVAVFSCSIQYQAITGDVCVYPREWSKESVYKTVRNIILCIFNYCHANRNMHTKTHCCNTDRVLCDAVNARAIDYMNKTNALHEQLRDCVFFLNIKLDSVKVNLSNILIRHYRCENNIIVWIWCIHGLTISSVFKIRNFLWKFSSIDAKIWAWHVRALHKYLAPFMYALLCIFVFIAFRSNTIFITNIRTGSHKRYAHAWCVRQISMICIWNTQNTSTTLMKCVRSAINLICFEIKKSIVWNNNWLANRLNWLKWCFTVRSHVCLLATQSMLIWISDSLFIPNH